MEENWKSIPGFNGYEVGDRGSVRSYRKRGPGCANIINESSHLLKGGISHDGYAFVCLMDNGKIRCIKRASLILLAFVGPRPVNMEVCHNNGIRTDNRLDNLRYDTRQGNQRDRCELTDAQIVEMRNRRASGEKVRILARDYNIKEGRASRICCGRTLAQIGGPITNTYRKYRFTDFQIIDIRKRRAGGEKLLSIAIDYETTVSNISLIARGLSYKHVL